MIESWCAQMVGEGHPDPREYETIEEWVEANFEKELEVWK